MTGSRAARLLVVAFAALGVGAPAGASATEPPRTSTQSCCRGLAGPPRPTVRIRGARLTAVRGSFSWTQPDGRAVSVLASALPLTEAAVPAGPRDEVTVRTPLPLLTLEARVVARGSYGAPTGAAIGLAPTSTDGGVTWIFRLPRSQPRNAVLSLAELFVRGGSGLFGARLHTPPDECHLGAPRPRPEISGEQFAGIETVGPRIVVGCARLKASERVVELIGYRQTRPRGGASLCLDIAFESGTTVGCGTNHVRHGGNVDVTGTLSEGRFTLVHGAASDRVRRVFVRYRRRGVGIVRRASVIRVARSDLLERLRAPRPFGQYLFEAPRGASRLRIEARGSDGRVIGRARVREDRAG